MVEPITCLIISCIIGGIAVVVSASIGIINIYATLRIQRMNEKQIDEYKKAREQIRNKYTLNATPDDYVKLACLLHLAKSEAIQCTHVNLNSGNGKQIVLVCSLQNIKIKYKPFETWYECECLFDDNDKSIWTTFLDTTSRSRLKTYLRDHVDINDLLEKCGIQNESDSVPPSVHNSDDESDHDYVRFERLPKKTIRQRSTNQHLATEEDERAYGTLGLKAPKYVQNDAPPPFPEAISESFW